MTEFLRVIRTGFPSFGSLAESLTTGELALLLFVGGSLLFLAQRALDARRLRARLSPAEITQLLYKCVPDHATRARATTILAEWQDDGAVTPLVVARAIERATAETKEIDAVLSRMPDEAMRQYREDEPAVGTRTGS